MKKRLGVLLGAALVVGAGAACGGDGDNQTDGSGDAMREVKVVARDLRFVPDEITITSGESVRLVLVNEDDGTDHDLEAEGLTVRRIEGGGHEDAGHGGEADALVVHSAEGEASEVVFVADTPGTYVIFCTVDGHRDAGMVGRIVVV